MNMYIERDLGERVGGWGWLVAWGGVWRGGGTGWWGHEQSTLNSIMPVKVNDCAQWSEARATSPIKTACQS